MDSADVFEPGDIADVDSDGRTEAVYINDTSAGKNTIWYFDEDGTMISTGLGYGSSPNITDISGSGGDFDNDGDFDVAFRNNSDRTLKVGDMNGNFVETNNQTTGIGDMADFDGDGDVDVIHESLGGNIVYIDNSDNINTLSISVDVLGGAGDLDNDDNVETAYIADGEEYIKLAESDGTTYNTTIRASSVGGVGDIDRDGTLEIAYQNFSSGELEFREYDGSDRDSTGNDWGSVIKGIGSFSEPGNNTLFTAATLNSVGDKVNVNLNGRIVLITERDGAQSVIRIID